MAEEMKDKKGKKGGSASTSKRSNAGQFQPGSQRAKEAGRKGGRASSGKFKEGDKRTIEAGRKGGKASHKR